jgi:hypothetical protein
LTLEVLRPTGRSCEDFASFRFLSPLMKRFGSRSVYLVIAIWGLLAAGVRAESVPLPPKESFHLYLLVGQSNMAGRGIVTPADTVPAERVLMLNKADQWVPAVDPMHFDKPVAGVGLGRTFALTLAAKNPRVTIGLIPCAVGGSPIDVWVPGAFYEPTKSHPWDDAMRRAKQALAAGTLKGILWHQGESDATPALAPAYEGKLHDLIARLRRELAAPAVPFIAGQLGKFPDAPWDDARTQIDRVHRALPAKVPHTAFVSSEGLQHKGDKVHFDADSYRKLGLRYAEAYLRIADK